MPKNINDRTYDRRIFEQLEETITKIEKMIVEIADLKKAHRQEMYLLVEKHELAIKKLKAAQKTEVCELKERISIQAAEIEQLKEENAALKEIMNKDSGNSFQGVWEAFSHLCCTFWLVCVLWFGVSVFRQGCI